MSTIRIVWNGQGGELDSKIVSDYDESRDGDDAITKALIEMLKGGIVTPGDSFLVEQLEGRG